MQATKQIAHIYWTEPPAYMALEYLVSSVEECEGGPAYSSLLSRSP